jgi:hypothetical protein
MSSADDGLYGILILLVIVIIFRIIYHFVKEPNQTREINQTQPLLNSNV